MCVYVRLYVYVHVVCVDARAFVCLRECVCAFLCVSESVNQRKRVRTQRVSVRVCVRVCVRDRGRTESGGTRKW